MYRKLTDKEEKKDESSEDRKSSPQKDGKDELKEEVMDTEQDDETLAKGKAMVTRYAWNGICNAGFPFRLWQITFYRVNTSYPMDNC